MMQNGVGHLRYSVVNRGDTLSAQLTDQFHRLAQGRGMQEDRDNPEIVVSIGGDGTFLHAFHRYLDAIEHIAFVGIHTGHLGFFADWKADELDELIEAMAESMATGDKRIVQYPLVRIDLQLEDRIETLYALNEITIKSGSSMLVAQVNINDELFEMFRGDGICISTPSGSTAYNKSLGGAIIHPHLESIQIAEMASINNRIYRTLGSSAILPRHHHCDIIPKNGQQIALSIDHLSKVWNGVSNMRCSVAERKISFVRYRPFPFWKRVREAFIQNDNT